jgi:hypothetical protein
LELNSSALTGAHKKTLTFVENSFTTLIRERYKCRKIGKLRYNIPDWNLILPHEQVRIKNTHLCGGFDHNVKQREI